MHYIRVYWLIDDWLVFVFVIESYQCMHLPCEAINYRQPVTALLTEFTGLGTEMFHRGLVLLAVPWVSRSHIFTFVTTSNVDTHPWYKKRKSVHTPGTLRGRQYTLLVHWKDVNTHPWYTERTSMLVVNWWSIIIESWSKSSSDTIIDYAFFVIDCCGKIKNLLGTNKSIKINKMYV